jgi:hypothetical protein
LSYLRSKFERGDKPSQEDFTDLMDTLLEVPFYDLDSRLTGAGIVPWMTIATEADFANNNFADATLTDAELAAYGPGEFMALKSGEAYAAHGFYLARASEQGNKIYAWYGSSAIWEDWIPAPHIWIKITDTNRFYRTDTSGVWEDMGTRNWELPPYMAGSNGELRIRIINTITIEDLPVTDFTMTSAEMLAYTLEQFDTLGTSNYDKIWTTLISDELHQGKTAVYRYCSHWGPVWNGPMDLGNQQSAVDCFIKLPSDVNNPIEATLVENIGLDTRYFVDTSLIGKVTRRNVYVTSENFTRRTGSEGVAGFKYPELNMEQGYKLDYCDHWAFECYPVKVDGVLTECAWTPAGDSAMLFHHVDDSTDGWGNDAELNDYGAAKRYTLNQPQLNYLSTMMESYPDQIFTAVAAPRWIDAGDYKLLSVNNVVVSSAHWVDATDPKYWSNYPNSGDPFVPGSVWVPYLTDQGENNGYWWPVDVMAMFIQTSELDTIIAAGAYDVRLTWKAQIAGNTWLTGYYSNPTIDTITAMTTLPGIGVSPTYLGHFDKAILTKIELLVGV